MEYKKLAPTYSILMEYKRGQDKERYIQRYEAEVLDRLNPDDVVRDLLILTGNRKGLDYGPEILLVCYEKSSDFCHRHLVAQWLSEHGYEIKEMPV